MYNYFTINGKSYAIDLEKLIQFIGKDGSSMSSISQSYGIDSDTSLSLINKEVTETKENVSDVMSNYRYNVITNILNLILMPISDGNGALIITEDSLQMHLGQKIAFNTLIAMEIIYEIDETEE